MQQRRCNELQCASRREYPSPIRVWVVEDNMLGQFRDSFEFRMFRASHHDVSIIWTHTGGNKASREFGLEALLVPLFRDGRLRLPYLTAEARAFTREFAAEATGYPFARRSDALMALWLGELNVREILAKGRRLQPVPNLGVGGKMPLYLQRQRQEMTLCPVCDAPMRPVYTAGGRVVSMVCANGHGEPGVAGLGVYGTGNEIADVALNISRIEKGR